MLTFGQSADKPVMVQPHVTHRDEAQTTHYDIVTHTCPEGYEGHYVDQRPGFESDYWLSLGGEGWIPFNTFSSDPAFTVCFEKKFMDELRKNPDMKAMRPQPPRGV